MKVPDYTATNLDRLPNGHAFTFADFTCEVNKKEAVIKALNRKVASDRIAKLSKVKYYKTREYHIWQPLHQKELTEEILKPS